MNYYMAAKSHLPTEGRHERSYLAGELESLGFSPISINQLLARNSDDDGNEKLRSLVKTTKDNLLQEFNETHK